MMFYIKLFFFCVLIIIQVEKPASNSISSVNMCLPFLKFDFTFAREISFSVGYTPLCRLKALRLYFFLMLTILWGW